jgi:branched-chain amino acid aminotransferase
MQKRGAAMSMDDKDGEIWFDGEWYPWRDAKIHILTHSLHYGMGFFEGLRAYETADGPAIFRLQDHTDRFFRSAKILNMQVNYDKELLNKIQKEVIQRNGLKSGYIRPICFFGSEGMGLHAENLETHVCISAWPWGAYLGDENLKNGIRVKTSSFSRHHVNVSMCKAKATGNYMNSIMALKEAVSAGCDEALLLDTNGYVAEGSGENIFLVKNGAIYTPQLTSCLEGLTRDTMLVFAKELGIDVHETLITRDEVYIADECFFTGTAAEVTPIREVDGRSINGGKPGPITQKLQSMYFDVVKGKSKDHKAWLTYV